MNAGADQLVDAQRLESPVMDSVRCNAGARLDGHAPGQLELERHAVAGHRAHELHADEDFSTEPRGLCMDVGCELGAAHAVGEAWVVLDSGARPGLSAWSERFDDERS